MRSGGLAVPAPPSLLGTDLGSPRDNADDAKPICRNIPIALDIAPEPNVGFSGALTSGNNFDRTRGSINPDPVAGPKDGP